MELISKNRKRYALSAHIVLTVKYRRSLLKRYGNFVKNSFLEISKVYDFKIQEIEVDKNHIHLLVSYQPKQSISKIIESLKQISTYELWKKKIFWNSGYFVSSIGEINEEKIVRYIHKQGSAQPNRS